MSERTPEELLEAIESLDTVIGETFPAGALRVVNRPAAIRSIENLWIARRTLGSIHHLMAYTVTGKDRDRTEDAAVLVRRLIELLADTFWLTDWDETSPDDQALRSQLMSETERRNPHRDSHPTTAHNGTYGRVTRPYMMVWGALQAKRHHPLQVLPGTRRSDPSPIWVAFGRWTANGG